MDAVFWVPHIELREELAAITGLRFNCYRDHRSGLPILQSVGKPDDDQNDVLQYLHLNGAVRVKEPPVPGRQETPFPRGVVWVDGVNPYALAVCREDLRADLPRKSLRVAKGTIDAITGTNWTLNRASLTTAVPPDRESRLFDILARLEEKALVRLDYRGASTVAIHAVSSQLQQPGRAFAPKPFRAARPGKPYDVGAFGPLTVFKGGRMAPRPHGIG